MMNKIITSMLLITLIGFTCIFTCYLMDNGGTLNENDAKYRGITLENKTELEISSEGPLNYVRLIKDIRTSPFFEGYNKETLIWMESLNQKEVFISNNSYVIMNKKDASKINTEYVTDAYTVEYIRCIIVENRTLGGNHSKDILLVKDVENLGNKTFFMDV